VAATRILGVEDDRWHTNASRRVLRHRRRCQMPTGGGNGRTRGEGPSRCRSCGSTSRNHVSHSEWAPSSGPRTAAGRPPEDRLRR
jgi:hypothetical protein